MKRQPGISEAEMISQYKDTVNEKNQQLKVITIFLSYRLLIMNSLSNRLSLMNKNMRLKDSILILKILRKNFIILEKENKLLKINKVEK